MSRNGRDSFDRYYDRRDRNFGNYDDRSFYRDMDYRRNRLIRETQDYNNWDDRTWYNDADRYDDMRRKRSWNESESLSPRVNYNEGGLIDRDAELCTVFVGGLPTFITECDIEDNLNMSGLRAKDIRVVKKRDPGSNRGFAFVEFYSASEAQEWMDRTKGILNFCEGINTTLSISRSESGEGLPRKNEPPPTRISDTPAVVYKGDWKCVKCGCINFRRREKCFKCKMEREESDYEITSQDGSDFIGISPTETLLVRGLSPITDEARIKQVIYYATKVLVKDVFVARNPTDQVSVGFGFLLVENSAESVSILDALRGSGHPLDIDGCDVQINYSKMNFLNVMAMLSNRGVSAKSLMNQKIENVEDAEKSKKAAALNSTTVDDRKCDATQMSDSASPETDRYVFDETSGYYYDPSTELYYDAGSQYFYDNKKGCFLYWDGRIRKYIEVPKTSESSQPTEDKDKRQPEVLPDAGKGSSMKQDGKMAQEMDKWAKQKNLLKESSFKKPLPISEAYKKPADVGFKIICKSEKPKIDIKLGKEDKQQSVLSKLMASYGDSDSEDETASSTAKEMESLEEKLIDWQKLTCLLCKRVFTSMDILKKHKTLSDLHKTNLEKYKEKMTGKVIATQ